MLQTPPLVRDDRDMDLLVHVEVIFMASRCGVLVLDLVDAGRVSRRTGVAFAVGANPSRHLHARLAAPLPDPLPVPAHPVRADAPFLAPGRRTREFFARSHELDVGAGELGRERSARLLPACAA